MPSVATAWRWYATGAVLVAALATTVAAFAAASAGPMLRQRATTPSDAGYLGTELGMEDAPNFRLMDQRGEAVRLSDSRGKAVALAFLDPQCTDVCPLTATQFRLAAQALGDRATDAVFIAINVNIQAASLADVQDATERWGNGEMPNWYFLTGSPPELRPVWDAYHVATEAGPKSDKPNEQMHTPGVFLIDQAGRRRWYVSIPFAHAATDTWAGPPLDRVIETRFRQLWQEERSER